VVKVDKVVKVAKVDKVDNKCVQTQHALVSTPQIPPQNLGTGIAVALIRVLPTRTLI